MNMYKNEIKILKSEKREALRMIINDFVKIYIKLRICFPDLKEERINLVKLIRNYLEYDKNEKEVLDIINKYYRKCEYNENIDKLLNDFDEIYEKYFEYINDCFKGYEDVLDIYGSILDIIFDKLEGKNYDDIQKLKYRMIIPNTHYQTFDDEYKNKVKKILRSEINGKVIF